MRKFNLLLGLIVSSSFALSIDEAIQIALEENFELKEQKEIINESKGNISLKESPFLPVIDLSHSYAKKDTTSSFQLKDESTSRAVISYNLFNGFANYEDLQSAKHLSSASEFAMKARAQDVILRVKSAYVEYLKQTQEQRTQEEAYKLFSKQYDDAKNRYEQGLLSRNNLLQIDVSRLDAKQNLLLAKKDLQLAKMRLSNILGGKEIDFIEDIDELEMQTPLYSTDAILNRSEIKELQKQIESLKSIVKVQHSAFYPSVDVSGSYAKFYENSTPSGMQIFPKEQTTIALNASWRIYQGGENFDRIEIYKRQIAQKNAILNQLKLDIQLQLDEALLNYDLAKNNYETSKVALQQAQENYKIVSIRYKEGLETTTDMINANYLLSGAKQRYYNAYYDKYLTSETIKRVLELESKAL